MSEVQRADPNGRRRMILLTRIVVIVLAPLLIGLNSNVKSIEDWLAQPGETLASGKLFIIVAAWFVIQNVARTVSEPCESVSLL